MRTELLIWSFFMLCLVVHSACESTSNPKTGDYTPLKKQHDRLKHKGKLTNSLDRSRNISDLPTFFFANCINVIRLQMYMI